MPIDAEKYKRTLARWTTGVTIVTARHGDRIHGMTVSAFCSVSLDPPLVLVCAATSSNTHQLIREAESFAVNILSEGQEELSQRFASRREEHRRFEGLECRRGTTGCPYIPGAAATLDCRVVQTMESGDHVIYVGEVIESEFSERRPLVYHRGAYRRITGTEDLS